MNFFNLKIFFLIILYLFLLFAIVHPNEYLKAHDDALFAFVQGPTKFGEFCAGKGVTNEQSTNLLAQFHGTLIGILNFMQQNWHCDKVIFSKREKCLEYHGHLDILYEYLFNVYAERTEEEPIFSKYYIASPVNQEFDPIPQTFLGIMLSLSKIAKYYFGNTKDITEDEYGKAAFKLEKSDDLNYYAANSDKITENPNDSEQIRAKFDKIMQKMLKKALKNVRSNRTEYGQLSQKFYQKELEIAKLKNDPEKERVPTPLTPLALGQKDAAKKCAFALDFLIFYDMREAVEEEAFVDFVKGKANLEAHLTNLNELEPEEKRTKDECLVHFENMLCLVYVMKKDWNCANAKLKNKCQQFRQYLGIIFEYLFRVSVGIPSVRPMFRVRAPSAGKKHIYLRFEILNFVNVLFFFSKFENEEYLDGIDSNLELINKTELNFNIKEIPKTTLEEQLVLMAKKICERRNGDKNGQQINANELEGLLRNAFDQFLKEKYEKKLKEAFEGRAELDVLQSKIIEEKEGAISYLHFMENGKFDQKYGHLLRMPPFVTENEQRANQEAYKEARDALLSKVLQRNAKKDEYFKKKEIYRDKNWLLLESPFVPQMPWNFFKLDCRDMQEEPIWNIGLFSISEDTGYMVKCRECKGNWETYYDTEWPEWYNDSLEEHLFSPIHANSEYAKKFKELEKEKGRNT